MTHDPIALRPRNTGEILDDAWRLAWSDGAALLMLSALFQVPAFSALLWLMAHPQSGHVLERLLLPLLTAALLALTGLGSGACQEVLRRRAESQPVALAGCLLAALRRGLGHVAARAATLVGILVGLGCLLMPGLTLWSAACTVHAGLAHGKTGSLGEVRLGREARFDAAKAALVVLTRIPIFLLAMVNFVLFLQMGLWVAGNLAGVDVALLDVGLSWGNPVFLLAAGLFCWLLLTPYFESANFLLFLDTRVRQEGLDLLYRVDRVIRQTPAAPGTPRRTAVVATALTLLCLAGTARADEPLDTVRKMRGQIARVRDEVKAADPYRGGDRWAAQLAEAEELGARRFPWLRKGLEGFAQRSQASAVGVLTDLDQRLQVVEESLTPGSEAPGPGRDDIKGMLRPRDDNGKPVRAENEVRKDNDKKQVDRRPRELGDDNMPMRRRGPGVIQSGGGGAIGALFWPIMIGLFLAVLITGCVLWFKRGDWPARVTATVAPAQVQPPPAPHEQAPTALFRRAEELARAGYFKEATRSLYHAVLSLLHRQQLLHYETTRTNGEYVRQVRLAASAPPRLHEPFARLTALFDNLWYGDRNCLASEYENCHALAEEIRQGVE